MAVFIPSLLALIYVCGAFFQQSANHFGRANVCAYRVLVLKVRSEL